MVMESPSCAYTPDAVRVCRTAALACLLLVCGGGLSAQEVPQEGDLHWQQVRALLEADIEARVEVEVGTTVRRRDIALEKQFEWPLKAPKLTLREMAERVHAAVAEALEERFPAQSLEESMQQIRERLKPWEAGSKVSLVLRGGVGPNAFASGILHEVTPLRVRVGSRWVLRRDLSDEDEARLYKEVHAPLLEKLLNVERLRFEARRDGWREDHQAEVEQRLCRQNGYTQIAGQWIARWNIVERIYTQRRDRLAAEVRNRLEQQLYPARGFSCNERRQEWLPKRSLLRLHAGRQYSPRGREIDVEPPPADPHLEYHALDASVGGRARAEADAKADGAAGE